MQIKGLTEREDAGPLKWADGAADRELLRTHHDCLVTDGPSEQARERIDAPGKPAEKPEGIPHAPGRVDREILKTVHCT